METKNLDNILKDIIKLKEGDFLLERLWLILTPDKIRQILEENHSIEESIKSSNEFPVGTVLFNRLSKYFEYLGSDNI